MECANVTLYDMFGFQQREESFFGEEDNNYVMTSNNSKEPSGGFARLQSPLIEASGFDTRKKKIMNDRHYDFIMLFVC